MCQGLRYLPDCLGPLSATCFYESLTNIVRCSLPVLADTRTVILHPGSDINHYHLYCHAV